MTDHADLRRLAEQASSGNWYGEDSQVLIGKHAVAYCNHKVDAQFIGKANPKTILAMLDEIDRLKAENDELRRLCSCATQYDLSMTLRRMIDAVLEGDKP
ncbi:ead/Ea22-like family protein [Pseudomonas aeruginosa]|uniref:ead/Ea22-like family protein n=1 Tax=Pseudomonas aeruginosa TaxID=287 RepID=UPI00300671EA